MSKLEHCHPLTGSKSNEFFGLFSFTTKNNNSNKCWERRARSDIICRKVFLFFLPEGLFWFPTASQVRMKHDIGLSAPAECKWKYGQLRRRRDNTMLRFWYLSDICRDQAAPGLASISWNIGQVILIVSVSVGSWQWLGLYGILCKLPLLPPLSTLALPLNPVFSLLWYGRAGDMEPATYALCFLKIKTHV